MFQKIDNYLTHGDFHYHALCLFFAMSVIITGLIAYHEAEYSTNMMYFFGGLWFAVSSIRHTLKNKQI